MIKYFYVLALFLCLVCSSVTAQESPTPTSSPSDVDDSILNQDLCDFPCWHGITPGRTTAAELNRLMGSIPFYINAPTKLYDVDPPTRNNMVKTEFFRWWHTSPRTMNRVVIKDGVVSNLEIRETVKFTLADVLDLYGDPAGINVIYDIGIEHLYLNLILQLYYPDKGLAVDFRLIELTGDIYVPEVTVSGSAIGSRFYLIPSQNNLEDFVYELRNPYTIYPFHEGWIGIGGKIISPDTKTYPYGLPTYEANIESTREPS